MGRLKRRPVTIMVSFLVLDYYRPEESEVCLASIRKNCLAEHQIYYFNNGANDYYPYDLFKRGLCDNIIARKINNGGGYATEELFKICDTQYAIYVQCDQWLSKIITEDDIRHFTSLLNSGYSCVDLAGGQCGNNVYSERAHFIDVDFYNSIPNKPHGGPGPFGHLEHNEGYIQRFFYENDLSVHHNYYFGNNGKKSIRQHECGGITMHFTDSKKLFIIKTPTSPTNSIGIGKEDWEKIINGNWINGNIPSDWKQHSFECWKE
jgi:hypothetical protein